MRSGCIAFVYDADGALKGHCNPGNVDLKPMNEKSTKDLKYMLERHVKYTGSAVAQRILDNFGDEVAKFVRVMPRDYARVLREIEKEAAKAREMQHASK